MNIVSKKGQIVDNADVTNDDNAPSFKYKASLITNTKSNGIKNGVKIPVPLNYLSNFWRSLEIPSINCKVDNTGVDSRTFEIADTKLYILLCCYFFKQKAMRN